MSCAAAATTSVGLSILGKTGEWYVIDPDADLDLTSVPRRFKDVPLVSIEIIALGTKTLAQLVNRSQCLRPQPGRLP